MRTWKKWNKMLSVLLSAAMLLSLCVVSAGAVDPAAQIGSTTYQTLNDAITASTDGQTITLMGDIANTGLVNTAGKTFTIDLNGHTLSREKTGVTSKTNICPVLYVTGGTLTIRDSGSAGKVVSHVNDSIGIASAVCVASGSLVLESGTLSGYGGSEVQTVCLQENTSATISGGAVNTAGATSAQDPACAITVSVNSSLTISGGAVDGLGYGICGNGTEAGSSISISGGSVSGGATGIYHPQNGTLNITGGSITGGTGIEVKAGVVTISGSDTVIATGSASQSPSNNGNSTDGYAIALVENSAYKEQTTNGSGSNTAVSVTISAGQYNGPVAKLTDSANAAKTYSLSITGGKFSSTPEAYIASGYYAVANADADRSVYPYTVSSTGAASYNGTQYATVAAAIDAVSSTGTVTLLRDVCEDVVIPEAKNITLNLNGKNLTGKTAADRKTKDSGTSGVPFIQAAITNKGTLTVTGSGTVTASGIYDGALFNEAGATATLSGGTFTDALSAGGCWYIVVNLGSMTINSGVVVANQNPAKTSDTALINGVDQQLILGEALGKYTQSANADLTVNGGTFTSGLFVVKNGDWYAQATINGGTFTSENSHQNGVVLSNANNCTMTVSGGTFTSGGVTPVIKCKNKTAYAGVGSGAGLTVTGGTFRQTGTGDSIQTITTTGSTGAAIAPILNISGGDFTGTINQNIQSGTAKLTDAFKISGGYYTSDPSAYVVTGKAAVTSDKTGYTFMIGEATATPAEVATAAPVVDITNAAPAGSATQGDVNAIATALAKPASTTVSGPAVTAAANTVAAKNTVTADTTVTNPATGKSASATEALTALTANPVTKDDVKVVVQTYPEIKLENVSKESTTTGSVTTTTTSVTTDITLMCRTVVTAQDSTNNLKTSGGTSGGQNAIVVSGTEQKLDTTGRPVTIAVDLGDIFKEDDTVYAEHHTARNGVVINKTTASGTVRSFVDSYGFSPVIFTTTNKSVAEITANGNTTGFTTLQDAVNSVSDGQTITVLTPDAQSATVNRTVSFKVAAGTDAQSKLIDISKTVITAGANTALTKGDNGAYTFKYTAPSSTAGGNTITATAGTGGAISPSGSVAVQTGTSQTYAITPAAGYTVSDVLVDGKSVGPVTSYTFDNVTGPHTISVTFKAGSAGWVNPFSDVASNAWYYSAVQYVNEHGLFSGATASAFAPNGIMTRGMLVTVLYRLEGNPAVTSAAKFSDVVSGAYYADAVAWAAANKIVTGYEDGTFHPNAAVTREQTAAFLYRYASYKNYDTTQGGMAIREFSDYESIHDYALSAMTWCVNTGILTGSNGMLAPRATATRAQVAAIMMRFCATFVK